MEGCTVKTKFNRRNFPLVLMLVPGMIYLLINNYIPMAGVILAFKDFNYNQGFLKSPWCGFGNFEFLFRNPDFFVITRNTILYNLVFLIINTIVAVAIFFNQIRSRLMLKFYQTSMLLPYMISMVIVSYICYAFLSADTGFINKSILEPLGIDRVSWYSDSGKWIFILPIVNLWKNFGYQSIIYYATVVGLDTGLYEAAAIDGATRWQRITHVTLPGLKPTIITLTLMSVGRIFYSDFGLFYQVPMNSGPLFDVTNTIDTYVYRGLMQTNNIGMSSAAGFYQSVVGCLLVLTANFTVRKISKEDALF